MPVIRGRFTAHAPTPERRAHLKEQLVGELSGQATPRGPLIFEIPLEESDRFDVIVIWDEFEGVPIEDRDQLIFEGYHDRGRRISMAMGVTRREAEDQNLLRYTVFPKAPILADLGDHDPIDPASLAEWHRAMIEEGGIALDSGEIALRFPTRAMAEDAQARLAERLPRARWSIRTSHDSLS
jgi:hypothetical protein